MLKQLAIFVENHTGSLKSVTTTLQQENISLNAFSVFDSPEFGILRMVVDQTDKAKEVLTSKGFVTRVCDVIALEIQDRTGALDEVLDRLMDANINVDYIYSSFAYPDGRSLVIIHTEQIDVTEELLKHAGYQCK